MIQLVFFTQKGINAAAGLVTGSGVTNTLILRLKFETAGKVYNLKADDTPTGSDENKGDIAETPKEDDLTFLESIFGNNFLKGFDDFKEILKNNYYSNINNYCNLVNFFIYQNSKKNH